MTLSVFPIFQQRCRTQFMQVYASNTAVQIQLDLFFAKQKRKWTAGVHIRYSQSNFI